MTQPIEKTVLRVVSLAGLVICVVLALWGWKTGILTSQERMEALVAGCGAAGKQHTEKFLHYCSELHARISNSKMPQAEKILPVRATERK